MTPDLQKPHIMTEFEYQNIISKLTQLELLINSVQPKNMLYNTPPPVEEATHEGEKRLSAPSKRRDPLFLAIQTRLEQLRDAGHFEGCGLEPEQLNTLIESVRIINF